MAPRPLPAIEADDNTLGGTPVFAGSRLPVATLLACIEAGNDWKRIVASWPWLTPAHVEAARAYAAVKDASPRPSVTTPDGQGGS